MLCSGAVCLDTQMVITIVKMIKLGCGHTPRAVNTLNSVLGTVDCYRSQYTSRDYAKSSAGDLRGITVLSLPQI